MLIKLVFFLLRRFIIWETKNEERQLHFVFALPPDPHPLISGKLSKLLAILSWDSWVAASFLLALSVDKASNKREAYSQAGQLGQRSAGLRAGLSRGALWGEHRRLECT